MTTKQFIQCNTWSDFYYTLDHPILSPRIISKALDAFCTHLNHVSKKDIIYIQFKLKI